MCLVNFQQDTIFEIGITKDMYTGFFKYMLTEFSVFTVNEIHVLRIFIFAG